MLKNYLKIALRSLGKNKAYSLLNVIGLAIGMGCFILIFLFVQDELSYDEFHQNSERIYRIAGEYDQGGDTRNRSAMTTYILKQWLDASFPDIKATVRLGFQSSLVKSGEQMYQEDRVLAADPNFFEMFTFELVQGVPKTALTQPNSMVLSQSMAQKYFGDRNPVGETLEVLDVPVEITGVMQDMPANSHLHADFVVSMATVEPLYPRWVLTNATGTSHYTYVELTEGVAPADIETQLADYLHSKSEEFAESRTYFLQPLSDIHLCSHLSNEIEANGDILYVYVLSAVALIILFMACINYMNLAVARSANRAREVGIRKVVGASRKQLVQQFMGESVVIALLALFLAMLLVEMCLPVFNSLTGKAIDFSIIKNAEHVLGLVLLALLVGAVAGSYPALFLSAMRSITVMKSQFSKRGGKSVSLRKGLVVVQFVAAVALLASTLVIYNQLTFMRNKKLGINPELVVTVPFQTDEIAAQFEGIRTELLRHPDVLQVTATNNRLTSRVSHWREYKVQGLEEEVMIPTMVVSHDFFRTMQAEFVAGRDFSRDFPTDVNEAYIVNESAAKFLGLEPLVGRSIVGAIFTGSQWSRKNARIIGVVQDFHLTSLHTEIQPTIFSIYSEKTTPLRVMAIRVSSRKLTSTLSFIENTWKEFAPGRPMQYSFMDEDMRKLYHAEERFLQVFLAFTALAIAVTCLGLLGLSAYAAAQRTKEIGIRKVLGASTTKILVLISRDFIKLVIVANVVAWPIAWLFMKRWLEDFAYRIDIAWWMFAAAGVLALSIAALTVSMQALKAALTNPVDSLRYE